jgi:hypothetical protein
MADPRHERERANANLGVIDALWSELAQVAERLGIAGRLDVKGYDPDTYVRVYEHLLRHRQTRVLSLTDVLPVRGSAQEHTAVTAELVPTAAEAVQAIAQVEALPAEELSGQVERWYLT